MKYLFCLISLLCFITYYNSIRNRRKLSSLLKMTSFFFSSNKTEFETIRDIQLQYKVKLELRKCIDFHYEILGLLFFYTLIFLPRTHCFLKYIYFRYVQELGKISNPTIFVQFIISVLQMCTLAFQIQMVYLYTSFKLVMLDFVN